jgi:hypothetical protein
VLWVQFFYNRLVVTSCNHALASTVHWFRTLVCLDRFNRLANGKQHSSLTVTVSVKVSCGGQSASHIHTHLICYSNMFNSLKWSIMCIVCGIIYQTYVQTLLYYVALHTDNYMYMNTYYIVYTPDQTITEVNTMTPIYLSNDKEHNILGSNYFNGIFHHQSICRLLRQPIYWYIHRNFQRISWRLYRKILLAITASIFVES